jgi:hypothetical protein
LLPHSLFVAKFFWKTQPNDDTRIWQWIDLDIQLIPIRGLWNSTEQSLWEAHGSSDSKEINHILGNTKVHFQVNNNPQIIPIQSQINPVHAFPSHSFISYFLLLFSHLHLDLPSRLILSGFPMKILYSLHLSLYLLHASPAVMDTNWKYAEPPVTLWSMSNRGVWLVWAANYSLPNHEMVVICNQ